MQWVMSRLLASAPKRRVTDREDAAGEAINAKRRRSGAWGSRTESADESGALVHCLLAAIAHAGLAAV